MAKMGDTGIGQGGNFVKSKDLVRTGKVFVITGAKFRTARGEFNDQVNVSLRYEEPDLSGEVDAILSLPHNEVRDLLIRFFEANPHEIITGVDEENGLILTGEGTSASPYIFKDASEFTGVRGNVNDPADRERRAAASSSTPQIPF